jgi:hypothetical protein
LLDRQVAWLGALEDAVDISRSQAIEVGRGGGVAHEPT